VLANHLRVNQPERAKSTIHLCGIYTNSRCYEADYKVSIDLDIYNVVYVRDPYIIPVGNLCLWKLWAVRGLSPLSGKQRWSIDLGSCFVYVVVYFYPKYNVVFYILYYITMRQRKKNKKLPICTKDKVVPEHLYNDVHSIFIQLMYKLYIIKRLFDRPFSLGQFVVPLQTTWYSPENCSFIHLKIIYSYARDYLKIWKEEFSRVSSHGLKWGDKPPSRKRFIDIINF